MKLKGLMHREVDERLTEKDVAAMVGVSVRTNMRILADIFPRRSCDVAKVCPLFSYGCGFFYGAARRDAEESSSIRRSRVLRSHEKGSFTPELGADRRDGRGQKAVPPGR